MRKKGHSNTRGESSTHCLQACVVAEQSLGHACEPELSKISARHAGGPRGVTPPRKRRKGGRHWSVLHKAQALEWLELRALQRRDGLSSEVQRRNGGKYVGGEGVEGRPEARCRALSDLLADGVVGGRHWRGCGDSPYTPTSHYDEEGEGGGQGEENHESSRVSRESVPVGYGVLERGGIGLKWASVCANFDPLHVFSLCYCILGVDVCVKRRHASTTCLTDFGQKRI